MLADRVSMSGMRILDVGCGEGKNAAYLAGLGAVVRAFDVSPLAIRNARIAWGELSNVTWEVADLRTLPLESAPFDVIVAYGVFHCLSAPEEIYSAARRLQQATTAGGYNVVCAFNSRYQDLRNAHPTLRPTLLRHEDYQLIYSDWDLITISDSDLHESHPDRNIPHIHTVTRLLAQRRG
jgi:cyclopropane fatty-acyl-phospholipid synthase-like methyltransferase